MSKELIINTYSIEELLVLANQGLGGNTSTERFKAVTGCPFSYSGVTNCLKNAGCERIWVSRESLLMYQNEVRELSNGCSDEDYNEKIKNLEAELFRVNVISSQEEKPITLNLSNVYDKSRHSFTVDEEVYRIWESFSDVYYEKGALLNSALCFFMKAVQDGRIRIEEDRKSPGIETSILGKYLS